MIEYLLQLDDNLIVWLNNSAITPFWDHFMMAYSGKWIWIPFYIVISWVLTILSGWRATIGFILGIALAVTLSDQLCASVLRPYFERLRPANLENPISHLIHIVDGYRGGAHGFPSCHAANSFALATFLSLFSRRMIIPMYGWALLQCYSRLYLGVHYPGDVLLGAVIGGLLGFAMFRLTVFTLWRAWGWKLFIKQKRIISFSYPWINYQTSLILIDFISLALLLTIGGIALYAGLAE